MFDSPPRIAVIQITLAIAMAAGLLLSRNLWLATRDYPLAPVATWLPAIASPWDHAWWAALLVNLAAAVLFCWSRWPLRVFILLMLPLAALDQTRWQPWAYQYLIMMSVLALSRRMPAGVAESDSPPLNACRLIIVMTYVWSGLQKCNASFHYELGPWLLRPLQDGLEASGLAAWLPGQWLASAASWAGDFPLILPAAEVAIGLGLLFPKARLAAVVCALCMHLLILFVLGPLGHNYNSIVWPWNVAMMALVPLLFIGNRAGPWQVLWPRRSLGHWLAAALFGLLPALNFCDRWDSYLSLALYSRNVLDAEIELRQPLYDSLPASARRHASSTTGVYYVLDLPGWSLDELNVPPYPARRVHLHIARQLAATSLQPDDCILILYHRPHFTTTDRPITRVNCGR